LLSGRWLTCWWLTCWWLTRWRLTGRRGWLLREHQSRDGDKRQHCGSKNTLCAIHINSP
jgi:hypothetical protein